MFFQLLKVALGNREALEGVPTAEEWEGIYSLAQEQAVVGVMLQGIERLPMEQRPQKLVLLQWIGVGQMIEQQNEVMDGAVVRLCQRLDAEGIRYVVIKGQTLNALYGLSVQGVQEFKGEKTEWGY